MEKYRFSERGRIVANVAGLTMWWARQDSNLQPDRYERPALTIELQAPEARRPGGAGSFTGWPAAVQCHVRPVLLVKFARPEGVVGPPAPGQGRPKPNGVRDESEADLNWNVAVGMVRPDDALRNAIDAALSKLRDDGTVERIYRRYGVTLQPPK